MSGARINRRVTMTDVDEILALRAEGWGVERIAIFLHRGKGVVTNILRGWRPGEPVPAPKPLPHPRAKDVPPEINRTDLSPLYGSARDEDNPMAAARPFRPVRIATEDPLGGLRKAS